MIWNTLVPAIDRISKGIPVVVLIRLHGLGVGMPRERINRKEISSGRACIASLGMASRVSGSAALTGTQCANLRA